MDKKYGCDQIKGFIGVNPKHSHQRVSYSVVVNVRLVDGPHL